MKRSMWIAASLLIACAMGVATWRAQSGDGGSGDVPAAPLAGAGPVPGSSGTTSARARIQSTPAPGQAPPALPLPALDEPLRFVLPELQRRAAAGEGAASCRLAAELARCEQLRQRLSQLEMMVLAQERLHATPDQQAQQVFAGHAQMLDNAADELLEDLRHCDGVPQASPAAIARYWRGAALAGHLPSMTQYAVGNAFRRNRMLDNLPALQVYRREAEGMARRAAAAGSVQALLALAGAHAPVANAVSGTFLSQVVEPDPVEALALYQYLQSATAADPGTGEQWRASIARRVAQVGAGLTPSQRSLASRRAAEWRARWRRPASPSGIQQVSLEMGWVQDMPRADCGDTLPSSPDPGRQAVADDPATGEVTGREKD